jgi:hypothetical protein
MPHRNEWADAPPFCGESVRFSQSAPQIRSQKSTLSTRRFPHNKTRTQARIERLAMTRPQGAEGYGVWPKGRQKSFFHADVGCAQRSRSVRTISVTSNE